MESIQQPDVLAMPFANNGTKNEIPSAPTGTNKASLSEGFPQITSTAISSGGIPPERADMNALGNIATMFYYFMQCGGAYTFRADVSSTIGGYPKGALLWYIPATGIPNLLTSTINNNTNNFNTDQSVIGEAGSGKPWEIVTVSPTNFMDLISNQTVFGEKTFNASPLVPTPSTSDSSKKSANTEWVTNILNELYPVGSTYMTFNNSCPFNSLGIGTWELETTGVYVGTTNKVPVYGEDDECLKLKFKGAGNSPYVADDGVYNMISSKVTHDSNIDGLTLGTDNIERVRAQGKVNIISKEESIVTNTPSTAYADMESKQIYIFKRTA